MDDKTVGIIVMGSIVVAMALFATYMEGRQRSRDEAQKRGQVRRLRPSDVRRKIRKSD